MVARVPVADHRGYVGTGCGQLHYRRAGEGEPAVVCVNQHHNTGRMWDALLPEVARTTTGIALDLPGTGQSDFFTAPFTLADLAGVHAEALTALGVGSAIVVGYHSGSVVAAALAAREPALVRGLVLVGFPLLADERRAAIADSDPQPIRADDAGEFLAELWKAYPAEPPQVRARELVDRLRTTPRFGWTVKAVFGADPHRLLEEVDCPTLVVHGEQDFLADSQAQVTATLGAARHVVLPGTALVADHSAALLAGHIRQLADEITAGSPPAPR